MIYAISSNILEIVYKEGVCMKKKRVGSVREADFACEEYEFGL
jgi:hypothetical protein